jgi:peptidoglycan/xylan/chitin deacetylase (PgdA/CDA1 family)
VDADENRLSDEVTGLLSVLAKQARNLKNPRSSLSAMLLLRLALLTLWFVCSIMWFLFFTPRALLRWMETRADGAVVFSFDADRVGARVALTIDDAPSIDTSKILAILARHHVHATFFCIGEQAARYPHLLQQIREAGHEIGNHDRYDRRSSSIPWSQLVADLTWTDGVLSAFQQVRLFRPGCGWFTRTMVTGLRQRLGYTTVLTDCYSFDAQLSSCTRFIYEHMRRRAQPGSVMLLHDGSPSRVRNACQVLDQLLPDLIHRRGLAVGTVSEMMAASTSATTKLVSHEIVN